MENQKSEEDLKVISGFRETFIFKGTKINPEKKSNIYFVNILKINKIKQCSMEALRPNEVKNMIILRNFLTMGGKNWLVN